MSVQGFCLHPQLIPSLCCPPTHPVDQRFTFLPLRLSQLEHVCISFDNGKTTMNFTEAAMLIQGSACVYSRKVRGSSGPVPRG